jgi:hypothetical protein
MENSSSEKGIRELKESMIVWRGLAQLRTGRRRGMEAGIFPILIDRGLVMRLKVEDLLRVYSKVS